MTWLETLALVAWVPLSIAALRAVDWWARRDALDGLPGNFKGDS